MLERFFPVKFFGFGGFIDVVVDRCYGHGFDVNDPKDVALIRFLGDLNDFLLDRGVIKPTMMLAYFSKEYMPKNVFIATRHHHPSGRPER